MALALFLALRLLAPTIEGPAASAGLGALPSSESPLIVFSEFGFRADTVWAADPADPKERLQLAQVPHAPGFGASMSLSPDGGRVAYTVLPPGEGKAAPDAPAELWLLDLESGETRRLAAGIDLLVGPLWSPEGDAVVVRRSAWQEATGGAFELLRVDLTGAPRSLVRSAAGLFPVAFSPDGGTLYHAELSEGGSDLAQTDVGSGARRSVAHLSDGFARDWQLSPAGGRLAYLAQAPLDSGVAFIAQVLDLSTGAVETPLAGRAVEQFHPVWEADGALTIGRLGGGESGVPLRLDSRGGAAEAGALPPPARGFDVPLSWSPDGAFLAVRHFEGASLTAPGPSRVELLGPDGARRELSRLSDVTVLGWLRPQAQPEGLRPEAQPEGREVSP